jgi:phosphate transport system protein
MSGSFEKELAKLKECLLFLGSSVEGNLRKAIKALRDNDSSLAREVTIKDAEIDEIVVNVEDECMVILALQQPVPRTCALS